jgi:hypothetical protein
MPSAAIFLGTLVSRVVDWFTFEFAAEFVGGLGQDEWLGALVVAVDVGADRRLQVGDIGEGAAADGLAGDDAEEDLDHVQPRAACRCEMQCDSPVLGQPGSHGRVFVGGVVVADDAQPDVGMCLGDEFEEGEELDVGVAWVAGVGGDFAGGDVQRGEQAGGAVVDSCGRGWPPSKSGRAQSTSTSHQHHIVLDRPGPAATTTRWPLLSKQHLAHPRTDQTQSLDVAGTAETNQPPS